LGGHARSLGQPQRSKRQARTLSQATRTQGPLAA
jgi:hypothetical protein